MRLKCIRNDYNRLVDFKIGTLPGTSEEKTIQVGKYYLVTDIDSIGYRIIDDLGRNYWYTKELFEPLEEKRNILINEIINDIF